MIYNLEKCLIEVLKYIYNLLYNFCLIFSKGFFFYFFFIFYILEKLFHFSIFSRIKDFFYKKQNDPVSFLFLVFLFFVCTYVYTYNYINSSYNYCDRSIFNYEPVFNYLDK